MTSPLRRKRPTILLNTKVRTPSERRPLSARSQLNRLAGCLGLGVLAIFASAAFSSPASAGDAATPFDSAPAKADQPWGGQLHWRPYRPNHASRPTDDNPLREVQRTGHDEPLTVSADALHRDPSVVPVQRLAPTDSLADPFNDQKDSKPAAPPPTSGPASDSGTLPEPIPAAPAAPKSTVRESAPAKLPANDPFQPDSPKANSNAAPIPADNGVNPQPKSPIQPAPIAAPMPEVNTTTGKAACDKELADLIANTVDKVQIDISPKLGVNEQLPGECGLGDAKFVQREWPCITYTWKASALCHKPLYFEEVALERYGHSRGPILDPLVSAAHFFVCVPLLPYEMGVEPPCECEYSLGYYRPGSCAPWIIDGFPVSLRGIVLEGAAVTGAAFAIP